MSGKAEMTAAMESMLGTYGTPNKATRWYAARNGSYFATAAWCDMTITWAAYTTGNYQEVCFGTDFAYTVAHADRFRQAGRWHVDVAGIASGDIIFFDWNQSNSIGAIDHVGYVTAVNGSDIHTIEGNTSNQCLRRVRRAADIVGYGRPAYKGAPPVTPPPAGGSALPFASYRSIRAAADSASGVATVGGSSSKDDVLLYQKGLAKLVGLNYSSGPGVYGPATKASTKKFQLSQGWEGAGADGIVGPETAKRVASKSALFQVRDF